MDEPSRAEACDEDEGEEAVLDGDKDGGTEHPDPRETDEQRRAYDVQQLVEHNWLDRSTRSKHFSTPPSPIIARNKRERFFLYRLFDIYRVKSVVQKNRFDINKLEKFTIRFRSEDFNLNGESDDFPSHE